MNLVETLDKEIIEAMKAKDSVRLATLRGVKGAMKLQSIDHKKEINDELLIDVVSKEIKTRNESIKEFEKGGRQDLIDKTEEEIKVLSKYLPEQPPPRARTVSGRRACRRATPCATRESGGSGATSEKISTCAPGKAAA